jgi:gluconolactonase
MPSPDGGLYFSGVQASRTYKLDKDGNFSVWRENTNGMNGLFLLKDGRLLGAESGGARIVAVMPDRRVIPLATGFRGKPFRSPNDLIGDKKGAFTSRILLPAWRAVVPPKELGNVHYLRLDGEVLLLDDQIQRPNGIMLSLDEKTLYVADTEGEYVYAFDVQRDGSVRNKRPFVKLRDPVEGSLGLRSVADGMAVDTKGRLYIATASGIQVIDARGKYLGTIRVPAAIGPAPP